MRCLDGEMMGQKTERMLGVLITILIALPVAWLMSEFRPSRVARITFGLISMVAIGICAYGLSAVLTTLEYNSWYGRATTDLIGASLRQLEAGEVQRVQKVWRGLEEKYRPTYENRGDYHEIVNEAIAQLESRKPIVAGSSWDTLLVRKDTWLGHWENDTGYWIVINDLGKPFDIVRSGDSRTKMQSVSISDDNTVLKFHEGEQWSHTLTLKNKDEAVHEWVDQKTGTIWKTETMYKLTRATSR